MSKKIWSSGRESSLLDAIIDGRKIVEGRLNKGKFAEYAVGDIISLRRDYRGEDGVLRDGQPDQSRVEIVAISHYFTFLEMVEREGFANAIPNATSAAEAADEYNRYYSAADQLQYGVLGIRIKNL